MKKYTFAFLLVLPFVYSYAQQPSIDLAAKEVQSAPTDIVNSSSSDAERFSLPDGRIEESHNDRRLYAGAVKNGKLHGDWSSWYQSGFLCDSGRFVHGLPEGEWRHWDAEGRLTAIRTYNADKYKRVTNELVRYNPRRIAYPLTVMYHKNRKSASKYLHSSYSFPHHVRRIDDLTLQQWVIANITTGSAYQPVFDQSLHHGLYMNFFPNGMTRDSGYYKNGLRDGIWVHRDAVDGRQQMGNYTNGVRTRQWKVYNANGRLVEVISYNSKGVVDWRKTIRS